MMHAARPTAPVRSQLAGLLLVALLPGNVLAQSPPPVDSPGGPGSPLPLTLADAVSLALQRNEAVRLAREQVGLADAQIRGVRAGALPQVNASLRYDRTLRSVFDLSGGGEAPEPPSDGEDPPFDLGDLFGNLPFGQPNTWIASLTLSQPIYTGGRLGAGIEIADRVQTVAALSVSETEAALAREVREAYFAVVHSTALVEIAEEAHALATEQLAVVESFRDRGTASDFEVLQSRVERDNLEPQIVEARNGARLAELNLRHLLHLPPDQEIRLTTALGSVVAEVDPAAVLEAALQRPALRSADEQVRIREAATRVARAQRLPSLSASASFSYQAFPGGLLPDGFPGSRDWREDWSVGLQLSVPVFDGFRGSASVSEAVVDRRIAELQRDQLRQGVQLEVERALAEHQAALARIEARRATVEEAARALELVELRYETGLARLIEVSNARLLLQQARVNEANALLAQVSALAALEHAAGGGVTLFQP